MVAEFKFQTISVSNERDSKARNFGMAFTSTHANEISR